MMMNDPEMTTYIGKFADQELVKFCKDNGYTQFVLVTDQNLYPIFAEKVEQTLREQNWDVNIIVLTGNPVAPDDRYLVKILTQVDDSPRVYISVGSGTLTDMTRFVAHRTKSPFVSLPTAPSMDGYASAHSALTLSGMKVSVLCKPPVAIFADLDLLSQAPRDMIAAGFGDVLGKFTALADWALGKLIWQDPYSVEIAERTRKSLMRCVHLIENLEEQWEENIQALTEALIDVGLCMLITGNSRPASGSEHSCSHFWEMKLMRQGRPVSFHGVKVGFAATLIAERYQWLGQMHLEDVQQQLASTPMPSREAEEATIEAVFGPIAEQVKSTQKAFLALTRESYAELQERIVNRWEDIQAIASTVPSPEELRALLIKAGLPTEPGAMHLAEEDVSEALAYGHYLRNPFTVIKLLRMMGM